MPDKTVELMRKLILGLLWAWQLSPVMAQNLSARQVDSVRNSLRARPADTSHINALILLADYCISKPSEEKVDLDSAAAGRSDKAIESMEGTCVTLTFPFHARNPLPLA